MRTTTDTTTNIEQFIERARLSMTCTRIDARPDRSDDWDASARHFRITITGIGGSMRVHFSQGSAHTEDPTLADVLDCIASDSAGIENARGFDDWCSEYGYDTDSRKAARTFAACERQARALLRVLDSRDDFEALLFNTERL